MKVFTDEEIAMAELATYVKIHGKYPKALEKALKEVLQDIGVSKETKKKQPTRQNKGLQQ